MLDKKRHYYLILKLYPKYKTMQVKTEKKTVIVNEYFFICREKWKTVNHVQQKLNKSEININMLFHRCTVCIKKRPRYIFK